MAREALDNFIAEITDAPQFKAAVRQRPDAEGQNDDVTPIANGKGSQDREGREFHPHQSDDHGRHRTR